MEVPDVIVRSVRPAKNQPRALADNEHRCLAIEFKAIEGNDAHIVTVILIDHFGGALFSNLVTGRGIVLYIPNGYRMSDARVVDGVLNLLRGVNIGKPQRRLTVACAA